MARVLLYYAHPGHRHSHVNKEMFRAANAVEGITIVDLYAEYPRHNIRVDVEQERLVSHDVILFQHPLFWYSTPGLIKDWIDLTLQSGFAYGDGGDKLAGKVLMQAITAAGPEDAYRADGYQNFPLRTFLTPMEQTARLCKMRYAAPYALYSSLKAPTEGALAPHVAGYTDLLNALRDDRYDFDAAPEVVTSDNLSLKEGV